MKSVSSWYLPHGLLLEVKIGEIQILREPILQMKIIVKLMLIPLIQKTVLIKVVSILILSKLLVVKLNRMLGRDSLT